MNKGVLQNKLNDREKVRKEFNLRKQNDATSEKFDCYKNVNTFNETVHSFRENKQEEENPNEKQIDRSKSADNYNNLKFSRGPMAANSPRYDTRKQQIQKLESDRIQHQ